MFLGYRESFNQDLLSVKYLLLSFMLLQPPLRTSFYSTAKIFKNQDIKEDNFILVDKKLNEITFIINHDKVSHQNTKEHMIDVKNKELINMIMKSIETYQRTYLFESQGKQVSDPTLLRWLRELPK